jgi:predicted transglutaminase-like cysteine proteinase
LFKRKQLIEQGFPRQALLMTIVRDAAGEGHAILTVKTDHGEFVLDNLRDEILPWNASGYRFIKRQAQDDPNAWLDLRGANGASS